MLLEVCSLLQVRAISRASYHTPSTYKLALDHRGHYMYTYPSGCFIRRVLPLRWGSVIVRETALRTKLARSAFPQFANLMLGVVAHVIRARCASGGCDLALAVALGIHNQ